MRAITVFGMLVLFVFISLSSARAATASAMTNGPGASITVMVPCCNALKTNEIYSSNNGPSGHFWNVGTWIGRAGGISSQPLFYFFTLDDYVSGSYNGIQQCGEDKNYWSQYGGSTGTTAACAMSGYFGGLMNDAYTLVNLDPTYARNYNIETHSAYE